MTELKSCKIRKNFRAPNIGLSRLQNFDAGFVTTFLKVPTKTKRAGSQTTLWLFVERTNIVIRGSKKRYSSVHVKNKLCNCHSFSWNKPGQEAQSI